MDTGGHWTRVICGPASSAHYPTGTQAPTLILSDRNMQPGLELTVTGRSKVTRILTRRFPREETIMTITLHVQCLRVFLTFAILSVGSLVFSSLIPVIRSVILIVTFKNHCLCWLSSCRRPLPFLRFASLWLAH